jgi:hypothetical protein
MEVKNSTLESPWDADLLLHGSIIQQQTYLTNNCDQLPCIVQQNLSLSFWLDEEPTEESKIIRKQSHI